MVCLFSSDSSFRNSVASNRAFFKAAISAERSAISFKVVALSDSMLLLSAVISSTFSFALSRSVTLAFMRVSQNSFCDCSACASAARRSRRSLMMERTFTKWSSEAQARAAAVARSLLPRRRAEARSTSTARCATAAEASAASPREPPNCRREAAAPARPPLPLCSPTSLSLALHEGAALDVSCSRASAIAVSSPARTRERWSQRTALASQSSRSSCRNARSASFSFVSWLLSSCASFICSVLKSAILLFSRLSFSMAFFRFLLPRPLLSKATCASNSAVSISFFFTVSIARSSVSWCSTSCEWYS
mmetsp:Transcript_7969/g.22147  ORF Transcript_7969/g.22147 Transcript_7969/m.22147 type:complete len:306 (-) Transcript_7969:698-1615(-)